MQNLFLFGMMYCTVQMCHVAETQDKAGNPDGKLPPPEENSFKMHLLGGIFNVLEFIASLGNVHPDRVALGLDKPSSFEIKEFLTGLLAPFYSLYRILVANDYSPKSTYSMTLIYFAFHVMWIVFFSLTGENFGYVAFGFSCFFMNACMVTYVRMNLRERFSLKGNLLGDFAAGSFFYSQAFCQMMVELDFQANSSPIAEEEAVPLAETAAPKEEMSEVEA